MVSPPTKVDSPPLTPAIGRDPDVRVLEGVRGQTRRLAGMG